MERMIEVLRLMACEADAQIAALPGFAVVADEIALIFSDELRGLDLEGMAVAVRDRLVAIDRRLDEMSATRSLWTDDALRTAKEWAELRDAAAELLGLLGVRVGQPDLRWVTYVQPKQP